MKPRRNLFLRSASLAAMIGLGGPPSAHAATYGWTSNSNSTWTTTGNWSSGTVAVTNTSAAHRLNVDGTGASGAGATYTGTQGTTAYGSSSVRGLTIGATTSGTLTITGGSFSTLNSSNTGNSGRDGCDVLGNAGSATGTLNVSGGIFIGSARGTYVGFGSGGTGILNVNSGTATITSLIFNSSGSVNLNNGTLEVNNVGRGIAGGGTFNFNGGTLKARTNTTTFLQGTNVIAKVQNGGAKIDTQAFNITIATALSEDSGSTGGGLEKSGSGALTLSAVNTYTGATKIKDGSIILGVGDDRLKTTGSVVLGDTSTSGKLVLGDGTARNQTLAGLTTTGNGGSVLGGASADSTLTLNIASSNIYGGTLGGTGNENNLALKKDGAGTLTLTNTNSYTGATTVTQGKLLINGNISTSTTTVKTTGTLGGSGTVGTMFVESGGKLAPGNSIDSLTAEGNVNLASGSTFEVEIDTAASYDTLGITLGGDLNITSGAKLSLLNFGSANLITLNSRLQLIDYSSVGGAWNNGLFTFGTEELSDSETFSWASNTWLINYDDTLGTGDTTLTNGGKYVTLTVVPEPSAALIGGLGLLCLLRRRR